MSIKRGLFLFTICVFLLPVFYIFFARIGLHQLYEKNYGISDNMGSVVDDATLEDSIFEVSGGCWFYDCSSDFNMYNKFIFFINEANGTVFCAKASPQYAGARFTDLVNNGLKYEYAGINAQIDISCLDVENNIYRVYFALVRDGYNWLTDTNVTIDKGKIEREE